MAEYSAVSVTSFEQFQFIIFKTYVICNKKTYYISDGCNTLNHRRIDNYK